VVPVFLHYEGQEIILDVLPEIAYPTCGQNPAALTELTQQLTWLIEAQIKKFPSSGSGFTTAGKPSRKRSA